jgi:hypothetical protein
MHAAVRGDEKSGQGNGAVAQAVREPSPAQRRLAPEARGAESMIASRGRMIRSLTGDGRGAASRTAAAGYLLGLQRQQGNRYVQRVLGAAQQTAGGKIGTRTEAQIQGARFGGRGLDGATGAVMGHALGADLSGVRVHTGREADALSRDLGAVAFTTGPDIFFREGAYDPGSSGGRRLLAHELTHVVQQSAAAPMAGLELGKPDDIYEQEAERTADRVMRMTESPVVQRACACGGGGENPEQCEECRAAGTVSRAVVQRYSLDEFVGDVTAVQDAVEQKAAAAVQTIEGGVAAAGQAATSGVAAVENTVASGIQSGEAAIRSGVATVKKTVESGIQTGEAAVQSGVAAVRSGVQSAEGLAQQGAQAIASAEDWLLTEAGQLAVAAARELAQALGGTVRTDGKGIVIEIPEATLCQPRSIPAPAVPMTNMLIPLWGWADAWGPGGVGAAAGIRLGFQPSLAISYGPCRLQGVSLLFDPLGGRYGGTGQLLIGAAFTETGVFEGALKALGVAGLFDPPVAIVASVEGGLRVTLRGSVVGNLQETVAVSYAGGAFALDLDSVLKLGGRLEVSVDFFANGSLYDFVVCEYVLPLISDYLLASDADQYELPIHVDSGGVTVGTPTAKPIPITDIDALINRQRPQTRCMSLDQIKLELCRRGYLPAPLCTAPGQVTPGGQPVIPGVTPVGPDVPALAGVPTGFSRADAIDMDWFKHETNDFYPSPIVIRDKEYRRDDPDTLPQGEPIGVPRAFWPKTGKTFQLDPNERGPGADDFNAVLDRYGFDRSGLDADHVQDLQWSGPDEFRNLWPMDRSANRSAGPTQNDNQTVTFAEQKTGPVRSITLRQMKLEGRTDPAKQFFGRFFRIRTIR